MRTVHCKSCSGNWPATEMKAGVDEQARLYVKCPAGCHLGDIHLRSMTQDVIIDDGKPSRSAKVRP